MINMSQGSEEWIKFRHTHIGSSDIPIIMKLSPWKTPYVLWLEKTGKKQEDEPNDSMKRGMELEPDARLLYIRNTGIIVIPQIIISKEWEVAMASLDGIDEKGELILEVKCPSQVVYEEALKGKIPEYYRAQIQWALWVSGAKYADYMVYRDNILYSILRLESDKEYQENLLEKAKEFWTLVVEGIYPEIQEKDYILIEGKEENHFAAQWIMAKELEEAAIKKRKDIEKILLDCTDDGNCIFRDSGLKITRISRKGNVDWDKVCEKWKIDKKDLEEFRKGFINYPVISLHK